jgi:hypothetical protein
MQIPFPSREWISSPERIMTESLPEIVKEYFQDWH